MLHSVEGQWYLVGTLLLLWSYRLVSCVGEWLKWVLYEDFVFGGNTGSVETVPPHVPVRLELENDQRELKHS